MLPKVVQIYLFNITNSPSDVPSSTVRTTISNSSESVLQTATTTSFVYYPGRVKRESGRELSGESLSPSCTPPLIAGATAATASLLVIILILVKISR